MSDTPSETFRSSDKERIKNKKESPNSEQLEDTTPLSYDLKWSDTELDPLWIRQNQDKIPTDRNTNQ